MRYSNEYINTHHNQHDTLLPQDILQFAFDKMKHSKIIGSSTACLVHFDGKNKLHYANLGDSGLILIRNGKRAFKTQPQQHSFNCPFQLGTDSGDTPEQADTNHDKAIHVEDGDILVLATDGFFDNVTDEQLFDELKKHQKSHQSSPPNKSSISSSIPIIPSQSSHQQHSRSLSVSSVDSLNNNNVGELAKHLVDLANKNAKSRTVETPFSIESRKNGFMHPGGKPDDITVIVAHFQRKLLPNLHNNAPSSLPVQS